jgi:hypothetical protein
LCTKSKTFAQRHVTISSKDDANEAPAGSDKIAWRKSEQDHAAVGLLVARLTSDKPTIDSRLVDCVRGASAPTTSARRTPRPVEASGMDAARRQVEAYAAPLTKINARLMEVPDANGDIR